MNEQFDDKIASRIREVFEDYQSPPAEHGWAELKKRLPAERQKRGMAWLWWSSAAAVILLALGLGMWLNHQETAVNNMAVKPAVKQNPAITTDTGNQMQASEAPVLAQQTPAQPIAHQHNWLNGMGTPTTQPGKSPVVPTSVSTGEAYTQQPASTPLAAKAVKTDPANGPDSAKTTPAMAAQQQIAQNSSAVQSNTSAATQKATDNGANAKVSAHMMDMLEQDKAARQAKSNTETSQADKKVTFSIYAATYFNYAEGSSNQVNAGAGVSSDFRLSKRLKLSTGVALAQNSLNYNAITSLPQTVSAASFVSSAPVLKQQTLFAMSAAAPVFRNYNVSMVGLDVPINLKYEFNPDKSDAFISAGLSSGTFIDENYTYRYTYSNGSLADSQGAGEDQKQSAHNSFSNFYFARMLNFSFGVGYPVGKNRLVIEPFVKYPLGGLGAQDIRFGSGGVNLKFSFKSSKK
ncbi:outer membrane beta-barrel protein [Mucilaginibacter sp. 44-25]|uniref:outer membrane beta-barrel protein n=2 Tax=unclassified Mucilaginibacter TaxID=2617802 RepID=UPI000964E74D|nr:outer membrane beta-barrel protein [Mucilaginibacter sp. 44-25]OJW13453.1 MAG: hypothetical protein BGO48_01470 [Mucilaginibacter sp. 44-25]HEK19543.1 hypothetical protein [Bacteroidota bacterium]